MRKLIALVCILFLGTICLAEPIPTIYHVPNPNLHGGYCTWASSETAALYAGYPQAKGLTKSVLGSIYHCNSQGCHKSGGAYTQTVGVYLAKRGIPTIHCPAGHDCSSFTETHTRSGRPVVAGYTSRPGAGHAVVIPPGGYTPTIVHYYDPNYPGQMKQMPRNIFNSKFNLGAMAIPRELPLP